MKINSADFLVKEGSAVNLDKWPTRGAPVYKSKAQYVKLLGDHVAQMSASRQGGNAKFWRARNKPLKWFMISFKDLLQLLFTGHHETRRNVQHRCVK